MARVDRMASLLRQEIATILQKKISDSRIGFVSIIDVELSKDLSIATVYYSQLGSVKDKEKTKKGLFSASKYIHYELGKRLNYLQTIPKLVFKYDDGIERGSNTLALLNSLVPKDESK